MPNPPATIQDGRRARRSRNREAVVDALFDLLAEESGVPGADAIAERAGVSVSSLFRYFDGLEDLKNQTVERYFTRYESLFEIPHIGEGTRTERIEVFVDARVLLYDAIAPIARLARSRAYDQPSLAAPLALARANFVDQIRVHFASELAGLTADDSAAQVALVDTLTSFEAWDLQHTAHERTAAEVS
ncbi:MAG TPA: TetR/AcrR family transcriptional regulator, partial [Acidimicrobiales bacterium]|nr:TetR/AcrR family transcriptional regulator [Acidimicrobiales bacterium]